MVKRVLLVAIVLLGVVITGFFTTRLANVFRLLRVQRADDSPSISVKLGATRLRPLSNAVLRTVVPPHKHSDNDSRGFYAWIYLNRSLSSTMPLPDLTPHRVVFVYYHWIPIEDPQIPDEAFRMIVGVKATETTRENKLLVNLTDGTHSEQVLAVADRLDPALGYPPLTYSNHWNKHGPQFQPQGKRVEQAVSMERLVWFGMRQDWSADAEVKGYTLTPSPVAYSFRNDVSYRRSGFAAAFLPESIPKTGIKCTISYNDGRRASFTFDAKGRVVSDPTLAKRLAIRRVEISEILQPGHKNPSPSLSPTRGEENLPFPRREAVGG